MISYIAQEYYEKELAKIRRGGYSHDAYPVKKIAGHGSHNLGPVDPPVVGFGQDGDPYYQQYLKNWEEVNALIKQLRDTAEETWGPEK